MFFKIFLKGFFMDIITSSYFKKFLERNNISPDLTDKNFELFINDLIFNSINARGFELHQVGIGGGDDAGIDGIGITINGKFIYGIVELEEILESGMDFKVEFHFIQAKTSEKFNSKEILNFITGVVDMFSDSKAITKKMNEATTQKYKIIQKVLDNFELTQTRQCFLYYVTPGDYIEDENHKSNLDKGFDLLKRLEIFDDNSIKMSFLDKNKIRERYEKIQVKNRAEFQLSNKIENPYIHGISESYFAIMEIKEYFNIVIDKTNNEIRNGIFELNVRDFGGIKDNRVNQDIEETIKSSSKGQFGLLNNGITIVGEKLEKARGKYVISNFYVVNGCQTTNVLFKNKTEIDDSMWISVKIVITNDSSIINDIVKATNNQTEVTEIQLLSMDEYQKILESYYKNQDRWEKLYYERRPGQYRGEKNISNLSIITPEKQIKSFASIFLESPNTSSRYVGKLNVEISKSIFLKEHNPIAYYTSSLVNHKLEYLFLGDKLSQKYSKFHQYIIFLVSKMVWKNEKMPQLNSKKNIEDYCEILIAVAMDDEDFCEIVEKATSILDIVVSDIDSTEITKSAKLVHQLSLYVDIGITEKELPFYYKFVDSLLDYYYKMPFVTISKEGDLRYNLKDRIYDIALYIYEINDYIDNEEIEKAYSNILYIYDHLGNEYDLSKSDRKDIATKILVDVERIQKEANRVITASKRYIRK